MSILVNNIPVSGIFRNGNAITRVCRNGDTLWAKYYTVRFLNNNGDVTKTQAVSPGESAVPPAGYTSSDGFTEYALTYSSSDYTNITADVDITPVTETVSRWYLVKSGDVRDGHSTIQWGGGNNSSVTKEGEYLRAYWSFSANGYGSLWFIPGVSLDGFSTLNLNGYRTKGTSVYDRSTYFGAANHNSSSPVSTTITGTGGFLSYVGYTLSEEDTLFSADVSSITTEQNIAIYVDKRSQASTVNAYIRDIYLEP